MALSPSDHQHVERFRSAFEQRFSADARFGPVTREDRPDGALLSSRFAVGPSLWLEMAVRPFIPQVRAGITTDDRWKNEELEEKIEETGDTMSEFIEMGFEEAGLTWRNPPVEHFREHGKYFIFSTALDVPGLADLSNSDLMDKLARMFEGYRHAFARAIDKPAES